MTPEELDRLRRLHEQLPPAPWQEPGNPENYDLPDLITDRDGGTIVEGAGQWESYQSHLETPAPVLLMELRNALPVLLAEIDHLTQGQKEAKAEAWEKAIDTAEPVLTTAEYDYLIVRNPYKEKAQ